MDRALSLRLEGAEGAIGASFVDARQRVSPDAGARRQDFDGTIALYDGPASPMSQTFGLGLAQPATAAQLAAIEAFFDACGCATQHEVSPLAGVETTALLVARGYRPIEMSTILVRPIVDEPIVVPSGLVVRTIEPGVDAARFIDASVRGWCEDPAQEAVIRPLATLGVANPAMTSFLVEADGGEVLATGSLGLHEGVALLAGASTVPAGRGRGAQGLLLAARLAEAHRRGGTLALLGTEPGSGSQRNAQRHGFVVAYTRTKWQLPARQP